MAPNIQGNFQICVSVTLMVKNVWCKTNIWTWFSYIFPGYNYRERFNFFRKYDVTPRRKMKDGISLTKYTEIWYLLQIFWKYGLFKKDCAGTWYFLYHLERRYFFPENMVFFPWTENERGVIFLKKYTETWYFLIDMPPCKKKINK